MEISERLPYTDSELEKIAEQMDAEIWQDIDEAIGNLPRPFVPDDGDERDGQPPG